MGAVDFEAFVHQLADVSGQAILPFFRTAIGIEDKSRGTNFDPVTAADRAAAKRGEYGMLPHDILPELGALFAENQR